jgi:hypothetical protein
MDKEKKPTQDDKQPEPSLTSHTADWLAKHMPRRKKRIAWFRNLKV